MATKLLLSFIVVLLLTALLSIFSMVELAKVNQNAVEMRTNWLPSVRSVLGMKSDLALFRSQELQHLLSSTDADWTSYEKKMATTLESFQKNRDIYQKLIDSKEEKETYQEFSNTFDQFMADHAKIVALSRADNADEAKALSRGHSTKMNSDLRTQIEKLIQINMDQSNLSGDAANAVYAGARMWIFGLLLAAIVIGLGLAIWIARVISRPLSHAVKIAQTVASGDLTSNIEVRSRDETGQLTQALKDMNQSLVDIVGQVSSGTGAIASASSQIVAGNLDLSARTEQQASSLEETASSMEELTSTVKQNADNARQANQLAVSASEVAERGGAVVMQVVETMDSIDQSSKKIVDIISVIDGIAFQTNILALNAAVEAARAGEQGRGFAVVATEVRNLAQRSASAAKEIKSLIGDSVEKVEVGGKLVAQAGKTMDEIVASVKRVTDIMNEITSASQEQTAGIEQINQAVTEMDTVTQQNAALVEEVAAAAESMQGQANNLAKVVGVFKLQQPMNQATYGQPQVVPVRARPVAVQAKPVTRAARALPAARPQPAARAAASARGKADAVDEWEEF
ncbi:methyl-accepting chemotaxis protein [Undibacterium sp. TJN25]|uniref:methyl-accepting chemotaxis protein n=1 Tax=Undibacterium sp. TJN25 TaxID=3413056 RepID=UPI003BF1FEE6